MPLGAMLKSTLLVGTKTMTQQPTGEWKPSISYTGATSIPCRIYDRAADSRQARFGDTLDVQAVILVPSSVTVNAPAVLGADGNERQEVKVDGIKYEVLKNRTQGNVGRIRELWVRHWK